MKKKTVISTLVLTMAIGIGSTAYALSTGPVAGISEGRIGLGRITSIRGYDYMINVLKNKFGMSDTDITNAISSGKTPYDLAIEKEITPNEFKVFLFQERKKAIDDAVENGIITEKEGENLKERINKNIQNCTGNFGQRQGFGRGLGRGHGMIGNGLGRGCFTMPSK